MMEGIEHYVRGNPLAAVVAVFVGGLLSASSPCVLAIMPMVIGYVGGHSQGDRKKALIYSLLFALGLAITFTILGAMAALFGQLMGDVGKLWYWIVAAIAVFVGLSLMGVFEIRIPFASKMQTKRRGAQGAFLLGLLFGVVSSPCATPVLVLILTFVATQGQVVYGTLLLFVYAIGHCALIILAGVVTGFVESFVEAKGVANFSIWAKRVSGALVTLAGLYILYLNV
ncbi:thiol:disulfide interchange protein [candidate division LCP-89 bacterium B3_LCP]|uniref:Thiol:disulfide interchange protein n=1 Tax=candidate division LCP-89 bacterium B3_LCP TaxID=2012998 RepID=A0A532V4N3_UNCL8|nr:MAG: thiol:disulfide interchange protein [candidate division LCP-89 bacterium B3_LCP]